MTKLSVVRVVLGVVSVALLSGVAWYAYADSSTAAKKPVVHNKYYAAGYTTNQVRTIEDEPEPLSAEERAAITQSLAKSDYGALDALAARMEREKVENAKGVPALYCFFGHVNLYSPQDPNGDLEVTWFTNQKRLESWKQANADSIYARIALMVFWKNYAWRARGDRLANETSEEQFKLFHGRLQRALEEAKGCGDKGYEYPHFCSTLLNLGTGLGFPKATEGRIYEIAIAKHCYYTPLHNNYMRYLLPRWNGETESEWLDAMTATANGMTQEDGDVLYARSVADGDDVYGERVTHLDTEECIVDWPRLERGMKVLIRRYPDSVWAKSRLCSFYANKGMHHEAQALFNEIGPVCCQSVWGSVEYFLKVRHLMFSECGRFGPEKFNAGTR